MTGVQTCALPIFIVRGEPEPKRFDLSEFIAEVNAMKKAVPALNEEGPQRLLTGPKDPLVVLERQTESREERALVLVNIHERRSREIEIETVLGPWDPGLHLSDVSPGHGAAVGPRLVVDPLGVRVLRACGSLRERPVGLHPLWRPEARIGIESVYPELDGGRYPLKRVLGDEFEVDRKSVV